MKKWLEIRKDIQTTVDFILALKPDLRVVINDYDDMDPDLAVKTYKRDFHGCERSCLQ